MSACTETLAAAPVAPPLLGIEELCVDVAHDTGTTRLVDGVTLSLGAGEVLGLVGESGCGKSVTAMSLLRLLPEPPISIAARRIVFEGTDLARMSMRQMRALRGSRIGMVFQEPMTSLNPTFTIGWQLDETLRLHLRLGRAARRDRLLELLGHVGIGSAAQRLAQYPHELSGGLRQRVMIAMALACGPRLLIADEPTTALDVTVQLQILQLLARLRREDGMAMLLITHDLGVIAAAADRVAVMYLGAHRRTGRHRGAAARPAPSLHDGPAARPSQPARRARRAARHPRHRALAGGAPGGLRLRPALPARAAALRRGGAAARRRAARGRLLEPAGMSRDDAFLVVDDLAKTFPLAGGRTLHAVRGVSFRQRRGETLGVVGESGCGKSTLARLILHLLPPTAGEVAVGGDALARLSPAALRRKRRDMQMIFQDPQSSLDPRMRVGELIAEPLVIHREGTRGERERRVAELCALVGLAPEAVRRYPHEFSGGQRQRVAIARALALGPALVVADEPVSALDVSIQAQVLNLLIDVRRRFGLTYVFISHDLAVVRHISDRVAVMYLGQIVELAEAEAFFAAPRHPYAQALLDAVLEPGMKLPEASAGPRGDPPRADDPLAREGLAHGCAFHPRCPHVMERCRAEAPPLLDTGRAAPHLVRCWLVAGAQPPAARRTSTVTWESEPNPASRSR